MRVSRLLTLVVFLGIGFALIVANSSNVNIFELNRTDKKIDSEDNQERPQFLEKESTRFVAVGHLYDIATNRNQPAFNDLLLSLGDLINDQNPDYVFLLGDLTASLSDAEWLVIEKLFLDRIEAPYYVSPGEHEFHRNNEPSNAGVHEKNTWFLDEPTNYRRAFPYKHKFIKDPNVNLLSLTILDDMQNIEEFVKSAVDESRDTDNPIIALGQHVNAGRVAPLFEESGIQHLFYAAGTPSLKKTLRYDGSIIYDVGIADRGQIVDTPDTENKIFISVVDIQKDGEIEVKEKSLHLANHHPWNYLIKAHPDLRKAVLEYTSKEE